MHQVDERAPVVQMPRDGGWRFMLAGACGNGRWLAVVAGQAGMHVGKVGQIFENVRRRSIEGVLEAAAYYSFESPLQFLSHPGIERVIVEYAASEWNQLAPLFAGMQHSRDKLFTIADAAVAMQQQVLKRDVQSAVLAAELHERVASSHAIERIGNVNRFKRPAVRKYRA